MNFNVSPKSVLKKLLAIVFCLLLLHIAGLFVKMNDQDNTYNKLDQFVKLVDFNLEANLPTCFSALLLLSASLVLYIIYRHAKYSKMKYYHWLGLSLIFAFLSLDEMFLIHEQFRAPMHALMETDGLLYYAWFIPYGAVVILLIIFYAKFLFRLPKNILKLFVLSGVIFVLGAVGFEALEGWYDQKYGDTSLTYLLMCMIEETMEMTGVIIFIYALLLYIELEFQTIVLKVISRNNVIEKN